MKITDITINTKIHTHAYYQKLIRLFTSIDEPDGKMTKNNLDAIRSLREWYDLEKRWVAILLLLVKVLKKWGYSDVNVGSIFKVVNSLKGQNGFVKALYTRVREQSIPNSWKPVFDYELEHLHKRFKTIEVQTWDGMLEVTELGLIDSLYRESGSTLLDKFNSVIENCEGNCEDYSTTLAESLVALYLENKDKIAKDKIEAMLTRRNRYKMNREMFMLSVEGENANKSDMMSIFNEFKEDWIGSGGGIADNLRHYFQEPIQEFWKRCPYVDGYVLLVIRKGSVKYHGFFSKNNGTTKDPLKAKVFTYEDANKVCKQISDVMYAEVLRII